jgi:hypothetical protein
VFLNPYRVRFLIHRSVATLLCIGKKSYKTKAQIKVAARSAATFIAKNKKVVAIHELPLLFLFLEQRLFAIAIIIAIVNSSFDFDAEIVCEFLL